ncbi:hypothetical protein ACF3OJ_12210 [Cardiobacterium hominis]|uniref:Uncharacterized protein n=1 Tax=Cardiobacterium hominis TaxID=2718 RepID=A0A1C3H3E8_9GAMM|nr:hypothetical protein [Cardiobacterium hominis]SAM61588.1 hypothetical protein CHUV0807_0915 [Cardiobacterium hominis]
MPHKHIKKNGKRLSHEELTAQLLAQPGVAEEIARLNREEYALLDQALTARKSSAVTP